MYYYGMDDEANKDNDRIFIGAETSEGNYVAVRTRADDSLELGVLSTEITGQGELVQLDHVEGCEYRIKESIRTNAPGNKSGPAQVATPAYRSNWDTIFGSKPPVGQA